MSPGVAVTAMLTGRWLELPTWMLDRVACAAIRVENGPCVHMAALSALMAVIRQTSGDGDGTHLVTSNAPIPGVTRNSHNSNRRVFHATPQPSSGCSKKHSETVRPVRPSERSRRRRGAAGVADTARSDAPYADRPIGLLTRLILDHARGDHHPLSEEAAP